jgi:class 3 adenylate cyclase/tetratricopeptide (TPR) repeat protein
LESWLGSLGLESYAAVFRARGIGRDQLADLTDADLERLGLRADERARFLQTRPSLTSASETPSSETPRDGAWVEAERRPLTMVFVDLVGSSRLTEDLAPEDLGELLKSYVEFCERPIEKLGGRIVRMVGDGLLAYFCHPVANENDPERAVRAALAITHGIGNIVTPKGEPISVRIGIATGPVVVGDLRTEKQIWRDTVVGLAPNLAARLQQLAPAGGIVIADETYEHLRGRFSCTSLGSQAFRGMSTARSAWLVLGEADLSKAEIRARASGLFGRDAELARLAALWGRVRGGAGAIAVVSGPPGIGKSRLVEAALGRADTPASRTIHLEGAEFDMDSPLHPVTVWLQRTAGDPATTAGGTASVLRERLPGWAAVEPSLAYLADGGGSTPPSSATPEQVREATLSGLVELALAETTLGPLRVVVDDLQWCDPSTLAWLERLSDAIAERPVLLLITLRATDDLPPFLRANPSVEHIELQPLGDEPVAALARSMLLDSRISPAMLALIQRKAGGTPLFVEEVVRTLVARDQIAFDEVDETELLIPANVHEALAGRLDRLGASKSVAQVAAVIGPDIRHDLLTMVCHEQLGIGPTDLTRAVHHLQHEGILAAGALGVPSSTFSHGVIRDAAYGSLLRERKQVLHLAVARALSSQLPEVVAAQPEVAAHHFSEGNDPRASLPHWLAAAKKSLARSALLEGTKVLRKALNDVERATDLADTHGLAEWRLDFMGLLGPAVMALSGYGSPEANRHYAEAIAICERLPDSPRHFPVYWGWWRISQDYRRKLERAHALLDRARGWRDPGLLLQAHHSTWASEFFRGNYHACCRHITEGLELYEGGDYRHHADLYGGHDAKVCGLGELAIVEWAMGRPLSSRTSLARSSQWSDRLDHLGSRVHTYEIRFERMAAMRDYEGLWALSGELLDLSEHHRLAEAKVKAMAYQGLGLALTRDIAAGLRLMDEAMARERQIGTTEQVPLYVAGRAQALVLAERPEVALEELERAEAEFERIGMAMWGPEMLRTQAEAWRAIELRDGSLRAGERSAPLYQRAIELARAQGATMLALRAACGLARLAPEPATLALLRRTLAEVSEDDGGPDLIDAWQLLGQAADRRQDAKVVVSG